MITVEIIQPEIVDVEIIEQEIIEIEIQTPIVVQGECHHETYEGPYTATPLVHNTITLETKNKLMSDNIGILKVPFYETHNVSGITAYIGENYQ